MSDPDDLENPGEESPDQEAPAEELPAEEPQQETAEEPPKPNRPLRKKDEDEGGLSISMDIF